MNIKQISLLLPFFCIATIVADEITKTAKEKPKQPVAFTIDTNKDEFQKSLPIDSSEFKKTFLVNFLDRDYRPKYRVESFKDADNRKTMMWVASWFITPLYEYQIQGNLANLDTSIQTTGKVNKDLIFKQVKIIEETKKRDNHTASNFISTNTKTPCVYCPNIERFHYNTETNTEIYQYDNGAVIIGTNNTSLCEQLQQHVKEKNSKEAEYFHGPEYAQLKAWQDHLKKN